VSNLTVNYITDGATSAYVMLVNTTTSVSNNNKLEFVKNLHIILIFLFVGLYQGIAQDPQLFENDWYLQKVIIDDNDVFPPFESVVGELYFTTDLIEVVHPNCEEALGGSIEYLPNNFFELNNAEVALIGTCGNQAVLEFLDQHYSIYRTEGNDGTAKNPFN
jgi:hypothetical protein